MVWRREIIQTLLEANIKGNIIKFIYNFLKQRYIKVRVNDTLSNKIELQNGIPQGSIFSVTLFPIAINKLTRIISPPAKISLFVDDATIFISGKNLETLRKTAQDILNKVCEFSDNSGFKFYKTKSTFIIFSKKRFQNEISSYLRNEIIPQCKELKILGITLDQKMSWKPHIQNLKIECSKRLNLVKILAGKTWGADMQILKQTYSAFVRAKLDYGSIIYNKAKSRIKKILDPINNTGTRVICGAFKTSPIESVCESNLPTLAQRRRNLTLNYITKVMSNTKNPVYQIFENSVHYLKL